MTQAAEPQHLPETAEPKKVHRELSKDLDVPDPPHLAVCFALEVALTDPKTFSHHKTCLNGDIATFS